MQQHSDPFVMLDRLNLTWRDRFVLYVTHLGVWKQTFGLKSIDRNTHRFHFHRCQVLLEMKVQMAKISLIFLSQKKCLASSYIEAIASLNWFSILICEIIILHVHFHNFFVNFFRSHFPRTVCSVHKWLSVAVVARWHNLYRDSIRREKKRSQKTLRLYGTT